VKAVAKTLKLRTADTGVAGFPSVAAGPAWMRDPARGCNEDNAFLFGSELRSEQNEAKAICRRCPFMQECRDWAEQTQEPHGVWGAVVRNGRPRRGKARPRPVRVDRRKQRMELDAEVAIRYAAGRSDTDIALALGVSAKAVCQSRGRLSLPPLYGPGGKPINREQVAA
jgi:hypothetical protein